jgi:hypothetical protein
VVKILGLFDSVKVIESPKYTKQRFCCAWLNNNAKGVLKKNPRKSSKRDQITQDQSNYEVNLMPKESNMMT